MSSVTDDLNMDLEQLRTQIRDLQDTLDAIRRGGVDAVIAGEPGQEHVYTLVSADRPYRVIIEEMAEGAIAMSPSGIILFANPRFAAMVGHPASSLVGTPLAQLVVSEDRATIDSLTQLEADERKNAEIQLATPSGPLPAMVAVSQLDLEGTPVLCLIITDLREQKAAEAVLRASQQRLARVLDALPVAVYIVDRDGHSEYANANAMELTHLSGVPSSVAEVLDAIEFVDSAGQPYRFDRMPLSRALAGETSHVVDMKMRTPPHPDVPIELWGTPVFADDGRVEFAIATAANITERKQTEQVLAEQSTMLNLSHDAVIVWDTDGRVVYWNRGAEAMYGVGRNQAIGAVVHDLMRSEWNPSLDEILETLAATGRWEGELVQYRTDGSRLVVDTRWVPHHNADGELIGTMAVNRDITARKNADAELARRAAELEAANRDISRSNEDLEQFAYVASHDLAEPLRAIWLPLSMLARRYEGKLGEDADQYIGFAVDGCLRMQKMIDDLLRWSRVGRIEEKMQQIDCTVIVDNVLSDLAQAIADAGATVNVGPLPKVTAERGQLTQIFQNLLSNALKFAEPGVAPHVDVAAEQAGDEWRFTVTDNGIGIQPRHRERIFGMFKRLHPRDEYPGTGIGLALAKKAVERHGGTIGVEDAPNGTGTRFWFTLPVQQPADR